MSPAEVSRTSSTGETGHRVLLIFSSCFILTATDQNASQRTPKSLRMQKKKEPFFFPYLSLALHQHLADGISKLGNSPCFHLFPTPERKQATPHLTTRSQVQRGKWAAPFHRMLS